MMFSSCSDAPGICLSITIFSVHIHLSPQAALLSEKSLLYPPLVHLLVLLLPVHSLSELLYHVIFALSIFDWKTFSKSPIFFSTLSSILEYLVSIGLKAFNRLSMEEFSPLALLSLQLLAPLCPLAF